MLLLLISLLMLFSAPFLYQIMQRSLFFKRYFSRLLTTAVTFLVVLHLLPESIRIIGFSAVLWALLGLVLPSLSERLWSSFAQKIHILSVLLGVMGLWVHGMLDGAALSLSGKTQQMSFGLSLAVLLHRIPAALFIWSLFFPKRGGLFPSVMLTLLGLSTIFGYMIGEWAQHYFSKSEFFFAFQALTTGSLLHIALDKHDSEEHEHEHEHEH